MDEMMNTIEEQVIPAVKEFNMDDFLAGAATTLIIGAIAKGACVAIKHRKKLKKLEDTVIDEPIETIGTID